MMKKTTLLFVLLFAYFGYAQQQQYLFDFESGDPDGIASNWYTFDNSPPAAEIIDNPDTDGGTVAVTKVLKIVMGAGNAFYAGVNNRWEDSAFGLWKIDAAVPSNLTVSMDVNKNYVGTVGIKMGTNTGATSFQITDQNVANTVVDEWQTLTWTISSIPATLETNINQIVVFVDWTQDLPDRAENSTILIDNITFNAEKLNDPVVPTCTDGIKNGDETDIDCGGTTCPVCPPSGPQVAAPTPTQLQADVISIYSKITNAPTSYYADVAGTNFNPNWGGGSGNLVIESYGGDLGLKYAPLNYQGIASIGGGSIDVSSMSHLHFDYWTSTGTSLRMSVISASTGEHPYDIDALGALPQEQWVGVDIPLSYLTDADPNFSLTDIKELKWDEGLSMDFYFDNIYFYNDATASVDDFDAQSFNLYPNPTKNAWIVKTKNINMSSIKVFDVLGKNVLSISPNSAEAKIDGSSLKTGLYFAQIKTANGVSSIKLIKK